MEHLLAHDELRAVASDMLGLAPASAVAVRLAHLTSGGYATTEMWAVDAGGAETPAGTLPSDVLVGHLVQLRTATAHPEAGAWYTAEITAERTGAITAEYDYDNEPAFAGPKPRSLRYVNDLVAFPRTDTNVPGWLRGHLETAGR